MLLINTFEASLLIPMTSSPTVVLMKDLDGTRSSKDNLPLDIMKGNMKKLISSQVFKFSLLGLAFNIIMTILNMLFVPIWMNPLLTFSMVVYLTQTVLESENDIKKNIDKNKNKDDIVTGDVDYSTQR